MSTRTTPTARHAKILHARLILLTVAAVVAIGAVAFETWVRFDAPMAHAAVTGPQIAAEAQKYADGTVVGNGQCWRFMRIVVAAVSGNTVTVGGDGYYDSYVRAGATLVSPDQAQPGDILQKYNPADTNDDAHVHTVIILGHTPGTKTFSIIGQNNCSDGKVSRIDAYDPTADLAPGWTYAVWRFSAGLPSPIGHIVQ